MAVLPSPADDGLEPLRVVPNNPIMKHNQPATELEKFFQVRALRPFNGSAVRSIDNQHIGVLKLKFVRKVCATFRAHAALIQQRFPLLQKAWMIMLPRSM